MRTNLQAPWRYAVVALTVLVAFALTWFVPWLRYHGSFLLFFGAVTFSAWFGGRGPGLLACLLAGLLWDYYIFDPPGEFSTSAEAIVPLIMFIVVALLTGSLTTGLADAEASARKQQQWLQVTLSSIGDGVIATDASGHVTFMNGVAETLTGWRRTQMAGQSLENVLNIQSGTVETGNPLKRVFVERTKVDAPAGALLSAADGTRIPIEGHAAPIQDADDSMLGAVVVFRDVHEREEARGKILEYQERLRSMASDLLLTEERERRAIADGLHDRVGQSLALTRIKLGTLRGRLTDADVIAQIDDIAQVLKQMIGEIRSLTFELSPPILYEFGLDAALEWLTTHVKKQHELTCGFNTTGAARPFAHKTDVLLFQATRELLTNVVKHAQAKQATVAVRKEPERVCVTVEDDGIGFDTPDRLLTPGQTKGFGLFSIRERIEHLGGTFEIRSGRGHGTCISLTLPVLT